jgi:hypothetical protein
MTTEANYPDLETIPLYLFIVEKELQSALKVLKNLEAGRNSPYSLDNETVSQVIMVYSEQQNLLEITREQCRIWNDQQCTPIQLHEIKKIESTNHNLQTTVDRILFLGGHYKANTIDRVPENDEYDLPLDCYQEAIYDPVKKVNLC